MLRIILIIVVSLVVAILAAAALKPSTFRVQRSTSIDAAPETIFALLQDFRRWREWSPYEKLDPAMKRTLSGADSGVGAVYAWEGNNKAGAGRMEITDASPPSSLTIRLDFTRPFTSHNVAEFTLAPSDGSTNVTWAMHGPNRFMGKVMGVFVDMDRLIGKDFETGLANIKAIAER